MDARFLLANERTFLAWVRTALALFAFGGAVVQVDGDAQHRVLGAALVLTGLAACAAGVLRHRRSDRALRQGALPATGSAPLLLGGVVIGCGLVLLVAVFAL